MNKKAFTLVEVLAVITILGIIMVLIMPSIISNTDRGKQRAYNLQVSNIKIAAQSYASDNRNILTTLKTVGSTYSITLQDISNAGYIELPLLNPKTNTNFDPTMTVVDITKTFSGSYDYNVREDGILTINKNIPFDVASDLTNNFTSVVTNGTQTVSGGTVSFTSTLNDATNSIRTNFLTNKLINNVTISMSHATSGSALNYHNPYIELGIIDKDTKLSQGYLSIRIIYAYDYSGSWYYNYQGSIVLNKNAMSDYTIVSPVGTRAINTYNVYSFTDNKNGSISFSLNGGTSTTYTFPNSSYRMGDHLFMGPIDSWYNTLTTSKIDYININYNP